MDVAALMQTASASPATHLRNSDASTATHTTSNINTNTAAGTKKDGQLHKGGSLHDRLRARHHEAIQKFKEEARQYNSDVDAAQQARIEELHNALATSHKATTSLIAEEQQRLADLIAEWRLHSEALQRAEPDAVLPLYTDLYHPSADEPGRAEAAARMKEDRLRLVRHFLRLRDQYKARVTTVEECFAVIEGAENVRRLHIQEAVRDLMASLTRIAVTSTTESQVLAQRILHHTNEQLGQNYLAMQTLATQLRQRELWKHQHYQQQLAQVYRGTQQHMADRHVTWVMTVLRSSVFRRPEKRMQSVHAAGHLIAAIRKEAEELVRGLTEVVHSLQVAHPSTVTADAQVCGGSGSNGWLRSFQSSVHQPDVFAGENPRSVLEEAQMRSSILVRHCRARCDDFVMRLRADEDARGRAAAALAAHVCHDLGLLATPLPEEVTLLQAASFSFKDVGGAGAEADATHAAATSTGTSSGNAGNSGEVDASLIPLTQPHASVLATQAELPSSTAWSQCVPAIEQEGEWFVEVVARGLGKGCQLLCTYATSSSRCMLVHLEGATDLLFASAGSLLGATRRFYVEWHEREMDYQDTIAELERQLHALEEELRQDETPAAAEARYAAGIACLRSIADAHTQYYEDVRRRIATATTAVLGVSQDCVRELWTQLGLALAPLRDEDSVEGSVVYAPVKRRSSAGSTRRTSARASFLTAAVAPARAMSLTPPAEVGPRVRAAHGEEFVEESSEFRFACMLQRGSDGDNAGADAATLNALTEDALTLAEPGAPFRDFYLGLLPELQPGASGPLFLSYDDVQQWNGVLRTVLLEWGLQLQRQAGENWRLYTAALLADVQRRVTDVLRHHRRRPATLQADVYEARVRELADLKNRGEKVLARIAERVSRVHTLQQAFLAQPARSAADRNLSDERLKLIDTVQMAGSVNAMKTALHRHDTICAQFTAALAERCAETTHDLEHARDTIEAECAQILRDRAVELSGGDAAMALPEDDPIQLRVVNLRKQVHDTLTESMAVMEEQQRTRAAEVQAWKDEWAAVVEQSTAELQLFQGVQEALSRLRAHVQTLLAASATEEAALAAGVAKVAEEAAKARSANTYDLTASLQALLRRDAAAAGPAGSDGSATSTAADALPSVDEIEEAVTHAVEVAKTEQRERVRAAPVCAVLAVLDDLRMPLYSRGCRLGLLAHSVEMWRLSPSHYVLPQALGEDGGAGGMHRTGSASRVGSARGGRRAKAVGSAAGGAGTVTSMGHSLLPLPTILTLMAQAAQWTTEVQANAESALRQHLEAHPGPLHRRLPGMVDGTEEQFVQAAATLCVAQEDRVRSYVEKAGPTYRQHVQELWNALQGTPGLLAATLEAEAAAAAFTRVECVLRPWQRFHARSARQWQQHRSSAKLSLASQLQSTALKTLTEAEEARSAATEDVLQQSWWWALREVQDEAGLHVARCWTALYTYLHLLSGLVTPQHLVSTAQVVEGGHHRGLRHLLELRAQHERAAAAMDVSAVAKREPRLQETMPLHRAEQPAAAGQGNKRHGGKAGDKGAAAKDASGAAVLAPLPWGDVELPGLPLNACAPLTQYRAAHPQVNATAPMAAIPYVPAAATATVSDVKTPQPGSRRQNGGSGSTAGGGRKGHGSTTSTTDAAPVVPATNTIEVSIPLVVPRFPLALECVQLLRTLVRTVSEEDNEAARVISDAFGFWERQEAQLRQTWALTIAELTSEPA